MKNLAFSTELIILASTSASRGSLLAAAGIAHDAVAPDVDEAELKRRHPKLRADELALLLARAKAAAVAARHGGRLVLAADQVLDCEGELFDKPVDMTEARDHLRRLRGRTHALLSAAVLFRDGGEVWHACVTSRLTMRDFSDGFLDRYIEAAGEDLLGSVGGYRIEGLGQHLMARVDGGHAAILGLPMPELLEALRNEGVVAA